MDIPTKIRIAATYANISEAELARRIEASPQAFWQRMKTGKFSSVDLSKIAQALGADITVTIRFPDGAEF